jgi:hypothetical protein
MHDAPAILGAKDVHKAFGSTSALLGASVDVARGEILAVMGPSGSGKSTLLHCLAGIFAPDSGEVWFDGQRVDQLNSRVLRRVVLLESVLPLISATVIAALTGLTAAIPLGRLFTPPGTPTAIRLPGQTYYLTMGAGLVISLTVIALTLPLLERITVPANARFE